MSYSVFIDENSRYQDPEARYKHGEFDTYEEALGACRSILDEFLVSALKKGTTADELFEAWSSFGEDPFIVPDDAGVPFSAQDYARKRVKELYDE